MKQTLSFHSPIIASTQSKVDVEAFEKSTDAFEKESTYSLFICCWIILIRSYAANLVMRKERSLLCLMVPLWSI